MGAIAGTSRLPALILSAAAVAAIAGCGGGGAGKSLGSIQSCLKSRHFTVTRSKPNPSLKMKGFLTVNDKDLDVLMTVYAFDDGKSADSYYRYLRSTHDKATLKDRLVLSGKEKGAAAKKLDACVS